MQISSVGLIIAFGYFSSFGNGFLDYRCLKEWEGKASAKGNFPSLVSNASDYWRGVWTEQIRGPSENFVPFARITGNRIWRVISQRRSTWLEVLALLIVYHDQTFCYQVNAVYTWTSTWYVQFLLICFVLFGAKDFLVIKLWLSNYVE